MNANLNDGQFHGASIQASSVSSQATRAFRKARDDRQRAHLKEHGRTVEGNRYKAAEVHTHEHVKGTNLYGDPLGHSHA